MQAVWCTNVVVGSCRTCPDAGQGRGGPQTTQGRGRKRPEKASQPSTMEAAGRRGSPRNRYGVAKVRWPLRAVWSALQRRMPAPPARRHTCCVFIARRSRRPGMQGCPTTVEASICGYLPICHEGTRAREHRPAWVTSDCLFVTMDVKISHVY